MHEGLSVHPEDTVDPLPLSQEERSLRKARERVTLRLEELYADRKGVQKLPFTERWSVTQIGERIVRYNEIAQLHDELVAIEEREDSLRSRIIVDPSDAFSLDSLTDE